MVLTVNWQLTPCIYFPFVLCDFPNNFLPALMLGHYETISMICGAACCTSKGCLLNNERTPSSADYISSSSSSSCGIMPNSSKDCTNAGFLRQTSVMIRARVNDYNDREIVSPAPHPASLGHQFQPCRIDRKGQDPGLTISTCDSDETLS